MAADSGSIAAAREKPWHKLLAQRRSTIKNGSMYPPFNIEPVPNIRSRLGGQGMSTEERLLRRQWIKAQYLNNEPAIGPYEELPFRKNIFRRPLSGVWNKFCDVLIRVTGSPLSVSYFHYSFPRFLGVVAIGYWFGYLLKYHGKDWTKETGWILMTSRRPEYDLTKPYVPKPAQEFFSGGFTTRKVLLNEK